MGCEFALQGARLRIARQHLVAGAAPCDEATTAPSAGFHPGDRAAFARAARPHPWSSAARGIGVARGVASE